MIPLGVMASAHAASSGPFDVLDLPGLGLWFDASDTASITSSATLVSQWNDKSGNARHMTQGTSGLRPYTGTRTQNGLNVIDHDESARRLTSSYTLPNSDWTWFVVWVRDADNSFILLPSQSSTQYYGAALSGSGLSVGGTGGSGGTMYVNGASIGNTRGDVHTACVSRATIWRCVATIGATAQLSSNYGGGGGYYSDGGICEVIGCSGTLSAGNISATESYLAAKWGITL